MEPLTLDEGTGNSRKGTVLVVDDNLEIRELTEMVLLDSGYEVALASDAESAIGMVAQDPGVFGLVLSDVNLPGLSGVELSTRLQSEYPDLPVMLVSGSAVKVPSGVEFLQKPYSLADLMERVEQICRNRTIASGAH